MLRIKDMQIDTSVEIESEDVSEYEQEPLEIMPKPINVKAYEFFDKNFYFKFGF